MERSILFSGPLVRALLAETKTQTRRIDAQLADYDDDTDHDDWPLVPSRESGCLVRARCRYGAPGDRLWVRESWCSAYARGCFGVTYAADESFRQTGKRAEKGPHFNAEWEGPTPQMYKWRPSIHMPRWASRITLEVTGVRVERLQSITEDDAKAEGADPETHRGFAGEQRIIGSNETKATHPHKLAFAMLWDEINIERAPWIRNPFVWVVSFRRVKP